MALIKEELIEEIVNANTLPEISRAYNKLNSIYEDLLEELESEGSENKIDLQEEIDTLKDVLQYAIENKAEGLIYHLQKYDNEVGKSTATKAEDKGFYYQEQQRLKNLRDQEIKKRDNFVNFIINQMNFLGIKPKKANGIKTSQGILSLREVKEKVYPAIDTLEDNFKRFIIPQLTLTYEQFQSLPEDIKELISGRVKEDLDKEKIEKDEKLSLKIREEIKTKLKIY